MAVTYERLAEYVAPSVVSSIDLTSISQNYEDLILYVYAATTYTGSFDDLVLRVNNNTINYNRSSIRYDVNDSTPAAAVTYNMSYVPMLLGTTLLPSGIFNYNLNKIIFPSYARTNSDSYKKMFGISVTNSNSTTGRADIVDGVYFGSSTAAITSIQMYSASGNFAPGSTATLYGIKSA